jgi:hypothetical protein
MLGERRLNEEIKQVRNHGNCLTEMESLMLSIWIVRIVMDVYEIAEPYMYRCIAKFQERRALAAAKKEAHQSSSTPAPSSPTSMSPIHNAASPSEGDSLNKVEISVDDILPDSRTEANRESVLVVYEDKSGFDINNTFDDYKEIILQFGLVSLFITSTPLIPVFALIESLVEMRSDAWKMCNVHKRPYPQNLPDIGPWQHFIYLLNQLSIVTNAGIVVISSDIDDGYGLSTKLELFFLIASGMFFVNTMAGHAIHSFNEHGLDLHKKRAAYIYQKHIVVVNDEHLAGGLGGSSKNSVREAAEEHMKARKD